MEITCPHCSQNIEIDGESLEVLKEIESFECPSCSGVILTPKLETQPPPQVGPPKKTSHDQTGASSAKKEQTQGPIDASIRMNRNVRLLGVLALLIIGGLVIWLASRPGGNVFNTNQTIRQEIIENEFFTRLIASGVTTKAQLEKAKGITAYGNGFIGLSEEVWTWNEAQTLARRSGAQVLDLALIPKEGRKELGGWLGENFPSSIGSVAWVTDNGKPKVIDCPDVLATKAVEQRRRVFLSWPVTEGWQNHGWSWSISARFDETKPFSEWGLAAVRVGKQWGLIDETGAFKQKPQFDFVEKVSEHGCTRVKVGDQWGLIDRKGDLVAKPEWEDVQDQINGFTPVKKDGKWGYFDSDGVLSIPREWDDAWRFSPEGYAVVTRDSKRGYIDRTGKVIVQPEWDGAILFSKEGLGMVRRGEDWTLIDTSGQLLGRPISGARWRDRRWDMGVLPTPVGAVGVTGDVLEGDRVDAVIRSTAASAANKFSDGLALMEVRAGTGFIDLNGDWVIPPTPGQKRGVVEGFAAAQSARKWGFIDRTGTVVVPQEWDEVGNFHEDRAPVKRGGQWGFTDTKGAITVQPAWNEVRPFSGGFAAVRRGNQWGFVDRKGGVLAQPAWSAVGDFSEGFAAVKGSEPLSDSGRYGRTSKWSFIASTGEAAFGGKAWRYWDGRAPGFKRGAVAMINSSNQVVMIDREGNEGPNRWWRSELSNGLSYEEQDRRGNYLNRHGEAGLSTVLTASDGSVVMRDVNSRTDLLTDFIPYAAPPKYGLIDMTGKLLVPPTWDEARILSPDWVWFRLGGKCGLADKTGRITIPPAWDELIVLSVRSGSLAEDGKTALVGSGGTPILSPWVRVKNGDKTLILRTDGTPAIPDTMPDAQYVDFYGPNHVVLREVDAQGVATLMVHEPATRGTTRFPAAAKLLWNWNTALHGFIWLQAKDTLAWVLKGKDGEDYAHTQPAIEMPGFWGFVEGTGRLHKPDGWVHIGADGKPISAEKWEQVRDFREGRAAVSRAGKWGFIDLKGALVGELIYDEVRDYKQGLAAVNQAGQWGFLALNGVPATELKYEYVRDLERGLAAVKVNGRWGYVDGQGRMVIEPVWDDAENFFAWQGEPDAGVTPSLDVAEVKIRGTAALIGRDGTLIVDPRMPTLTRDGAAYVNDKEQLIVMQKAGGAAVTPRIFPPTPQGHSRLYFKVAVDVSPAFQWQWSDAALKSVVDALAKDDWRSLYSLRGTTTWKLVNETGKIVADGDWGEPWYDSKVDPFAEGLISARTREQKYGLIRKDGSVVLAPRFDRIAWVAPGLAAVWSADEGGLMKADGRWLFKDSDTVRLARFGLKRSKTTELQYRHGLALIEDVPKWGYARLNRTQIAKENP